MLNTIEITFSVLEAKSKTQQNWFPLVTPRDNLTQAFCNIYLVVAGIPGFLGLKPSHSNLHPCDHFFKCVSVCFCISLSS